MKHIETKTCTISFWFGTMVFLHYFKQYRKEYHNMSRYTRFLPSFPTILNYLCAHQHIYIFIYTLYIYNTTEMANDKYHLRIIQGKLLFTLIYRFVLSFAILCVIGKYFSRLPITHHTHTEKKNQNHYYILHIIECIIEFICIRVVQYFQTFLFIFFYCSNLVKW